MPEPPTPAAARTSSKAGIFVRRLGSTVVLWAIVLWAIFSRHHHVTQWVFLALLVLLTVLGMREFFALVEKKGLVTFRRFGTAAGVVLISAIHFSLTWSPQSSGTGLNPEHAHIELVVLALVLLTLCVARLAAKNLTEGIVAIATTMFGIAYVPFLLGFLALIVFLPEVEGRYYLLYFVVVTKFSDVGAYSIGSLIGRHKMIPRISPGKTWEGFGGAIAVSTGASLLLAHLLRAHLDGMTWIHALALGLILSVGAVVGDLVESLLKREAGVKDSGGIFPGIGGILDLLDSLLFNAPLMYAYLIWIVLAG